MTLLSERINIANDLLRHSCLALHISGDTLIVESKFGSVNTQYEVGALNSPFVDWFLDAATGSLEATLPPTMDAIKQIRLLIGRDYPNKTAVEEPLFTETPLTLPPPFFTGALTAPPAAIKRGGANA